MSKAHVYLCKAVLYWVLLVLPTDSFVRNSSLPQTGLGISYLPKFNWYFLSAMNYVCAKFQCVSGTKSQKINCVVFQSPQKFYLKR